MPSRVYPQNNRFGARLCRDGRQIHLGYRDTEEEALALWEERAAAWDGDVKARRAMVARLTTVGEFFAVWAELCPRPDPETTRHNVSMVKGFAAHFDRQRLDALTPLECQRWAVDNLSAVRYARAFYNDAIKLGLCSSNPVADMALIVPTGPGRRDIEPPSIEQMRHAVEVAERVAGPNFAALVGMAATTGARSVELCRLEVSAVQRVPDLRVRLNAKRTRGRAPLRDVTFPAEAAPERERFLAVLPDLGPVFHRPRGGPLDTRKLRSLWADVREAAGMPEVTFHGLRHGCATWLRDLTDARGQRRYSREDIAILLWGTKDTRLLDALYAHDDVDGALDRLREPA